MDREFRNWINIIKCSKPFVPHANQLRGGYDSGEHPPSHTGHSFPPPFSPQSRTHTLSLSLFIFSHSSCICSPPCKNRHIPPEQKFRQRNAFFFHLQFEGPHTPLNLKFPPFFPETIIVIVINPLSISISQSLLPPFCYIVLP